MSQYHPIATMPTPGELVECQIERTDRGARISSLKILGGTPSSTSSALPSRNRETRLAVLSAAATFLGLMSQCREEVRSDLPPCAVCRLLSVAGLGASALLQSTTAVRFLAQ